MIYGSWYLGTQAVLICASKTTPTKSKHACKFNTTRCATHSSCKLDNRKHMHTMYKGFVDLYDLMPDNQFVERAVEHPVQSALRTLLTWEVSTRVRMVTIPTGFRNSLSLQRDQRFFDRSTKCIHCLVLPHCLQQSVSSFYYFRERPLRTIIIHSYWLYPLLVVMFQ